MNNARWDATDFGAELCTCDANQGGCGGIAVVNVARVEVALRVRRVEGEGAAEGQPVPPVPARAEALPEEEEQPEPEPISETAAAILGAEHVVVTPLQPAINGDKMELVFKWKGFYNEVKKISEGRSFAELPKSTRQGLIESCGREIAAHLHQPPTMLNWDSYSPIWMPSASGVANTYLTSGWKSAAERWHLQAKGLAT